MGGRAPRVLDPFAEGGAIPLEAMRLGCEATAVDVNPVAWFVLTCTLDWPRKLAGRETDAADVRAQDTAALNREFGAAYLDDQRRPRWVATPTRLARAARSA